MRGESEDGMVDTIEREVEDGAPVARGDGIGVAAFVTGCLGLGPVAIGLGAIGLRRWSTGAASRRSWPLAGLVLGVVGSLLWLAGWLIHTGTEGSDAAAVAHAQVDAITVGNAVVARFVEDPTAAAVTVELADDSYRVDGVAVDRTSPDVTAVTYTGSSAADWCITLDTDREQSVAYAATEGLVDSCS
ncbi:DUF4190 domain-containing protein [Demequina gelatinilytica]|uniref:DUF4190 domain-containing protein n=1 Tax=Demequina gelatinilytica TaxID=1638980 RepID=UPI0007862E49|nr:DUF4190 domain-containing protein [Demequina gelatinilytica]